MEDEQTAAAQPADAAAKERRPAGGAATSASNSTMPNVPAHCPYRRTTDLLQRLAPNKMRIGFFISAECSLSVQDTEGKPLIPDISGLTKQVKEILTKDQELAEVPKTEWDRVIARGIRIPTVEDILSHIRTLKSLYGEGRIDVFSGDNLGKLDTAICERIRNIVSKPLPTSDTAYHALASWIQAI